MGCRLFLSSPLFFLAKFFVRIVFFRNFARQSVRKNNRIATKTDMKKKLVLFLLALLPMVVLTTVTSCSKDDDIVLPPGNNGDNDSNGYNGGHNPEIVVTVNEDGTTSNGSTFSAIDDKNFYVDYIKYTVEEGHLTVTGYDKAGFNGYAAIIYKLIYKGNTYEVLKINEKAFRKCIVLTSATISKSLTTIGDNAFEDCSNLSSVYISNSLTSIGENAFSGCSGLTKVIVPDIAAWCGISYGNYSSSPLYYAKHLYSDEETEVTNLVIPNNVTSIEKHAFYNCSGLNSVTIPKSVTSIGNYAFSGGSGLTSMEVESGNPVYDSRDKCNAIIETATNTLAFGCKNTVIPASVTGIGNGAFSSCTSLTSVTIPNSVTSIGDYAFEYCRYLTSVSIPGSVTSIGDYAFSGCSGLTKVIVPDIAAWCGISYGNYSSSPLYYAKHIFSDEDTEITDLVIPDDVTSIGDYAFYCCGKLTSITIPGSVTDIGRYAFEYCSNLTSISIPNTVTSIGDYAFSDCSGLESMKVESGNPVYDSREDCNAIIETATDTLAFGCKNTIIPASVRGIGCGAFSSCASLTSINIPGCVTSIGDYAFYGCSGLTSVSLPGSMKSIDKYAFYYCRNLTSVTIENGVTSIKYAAFSGCSSLTDVYCLAESVPETDKTVFDNSSTQSATLHVPASALDAYKNATPWKNFNTIVAI